MSTILFQRGMILATTPLSDRILVRCLFSPPFGTACYVCGHICPFVMFDLVDSVSLHVNCPWHGELPFRPEVKVPNSIILSLSPTNHRLSPGDEAIYLPSRKSLAWIAYGRPAETLQELALL